MQLLLTPLNMFPPVDFPYLRLVAVGSMMQLQKQ
jgi:hypothetical protein